MFIRDTHINIFMSLNGFVWYRARTGNFLSKGCGGGVRERMEGRGAGAVI